jgi:glycosyltransferase involved in cell wall biosynthesis
MSETLVAVLHSGSPSAISRVGLEIARFIANAQETGLVVFGSEGPISHIAETRGIPYRVARNSGFASGSFRHKVNAAKSELEQLRPAVVYATSVACSPWVIGGKHLGARTVLHVHELRRELIALLHSGATCIDVCAAADLVVVSGEAVASDLRRCLGYVPDDIFNAGVLLDCFLTAERARQEINPRWRYGRRYVRSDRKMVVMWGAACHRNGIDIFVELVQRLPEYDFIWIGAWTQEADDVLSVKGCSPSHQANFYCTGEIDNPYPLLAMCDLFVLTARQAENPVDLMELAALNVRIVCFSRSIDSWMIMPQAFYVLHGDPNADRLVGFVSKFLGDQRETRKDGQLALPEFGNQIGFAHLFTELKRRRIL